MPAETEIVTLYLTGPFSARDGAGREIAGLSRRGQALLAFLSQQAGMRAERAQLADLLWSDRSEAQSRASLRQELSVLKRLLPEGLLGANRQMVWIEAGALAADTTRPGEFLQGFDLASEGFEDWLRQARTQAPEAAVSTAPRPPQRAGRPCLAVLPFEELGAAETDMFADGVVEEITAALSRADEFDVIARQSAFALRGEQIDIPTAAARLGAEYLVEGSVRRSGERVRIAVQLVAGADGRTLWSERFDDRMDDLFDLQDRIAAQVAGQVSPSLRQAEIIRARGHPPENRTAYELILTALPQFWTLRREGNLQALSLLAQALERDPDLVPALALKAWVHAHQNTYMWSEDPAAERALALELAGRAAEAAGDSVPALVAIGGAYSQASDDRRLAQTYIDRALRLDPNNAWAWIRQGWLHQYVGEVDASLAAFDRAERLSPLDPFLHQVTFGRAAAHYRWSDDPTEGLAMIEDGLRRHPGVVWPLRMLAVAHVRLGDIDKARATARRLMTHLPHLTIGYLKAGLPPLAVHFDDTYFDHLAQAGIPD